MNTLWRYLLCWFGFHEDVPKYLGRRFCGFKVPDMVCKHCGSVERRIV